MYKTAWFEKSENDFLDSKETEAAFHVLGYMATLGLTQEEFLKVSEEVYVLAQLDCKCKIAETPYDAVHLSKEKVDFGDYFRIKTSLSRTSKAVNR